jgi:hypothetical protein
VANLKDIRSEDWLRDGVLCPEHVPALQAQLLPIPDMSVLMKLETTHKPH